MLQTRHRPDKENVVHRPPKTPGPVKSIVSGKNPVKTPFHDKNQAFTNTFKKSVAFGDPQQQSDLSKFDAFQTPAPRRILGGKDLNTGQTPFHAPPSTIKPFNNAQGVEAWSPPFTKTRQRRSSRKSSMGIRISPVKDMAVEDIDLGDIEYMPPTAVDFPYEPADHEPIDWDLFGDMKADITGYFVKVDSSRKSEMDQFLYEKMDFGTDEQLPIAPAPPGQKTAKLSVKPPSWTRSRRSTAPNPRQSTAPRPVTVPKVRPHAAPRPGTTKHMAQSRRMSMVPPKKMKPERFVRPEMADELAALEREELELCSIDDYGASFDLEL